MAVMQHHRKLMQLRVAKSLRLDRLDGGQHIVAIVAGTAVALPHIAKLFGQSAAGPHIAHGRDRPRKPAR